MCTEDGEAGFDTVGVSVRGMQVKRLYVINDGAEDVDMAVVGGLLTAMGYGLVKYRCYRWDQDLERCEGGECDYVEMMMDRICIDEAVFEIDCDIGDEDGMVFLDVSCDLDNVFDDLYYIDTTGKANMSDMIFIAEVGDNEYVEFEIRDVRNVVWGGIVEELIGRP